MVIDFSHIDLKNRPKLILLDVLGNAVAYLGDAFSVSLNLRFNDVSELTFSIPRSVNGEDVPYYSSVEGTSVVKVDGIGVFTIAEPKISAEGAREVKECTAYSLEREWTYKNISLPEATYSFYNPLTYSNSNRDDGTVIGILMAKMPSWTLGSVPASLASKYRTFSENETNMYSFVKETVQKTYGCVFAFDTLNRIVNIVDVYGQVGSTPVYLSQENLIKKLDITESVDDLVTCLNITGAEGVGISFVNPLATDKLYNFDYFVQRGGLPASFVTAYNNWKALLTSNEGTFYNLSVERAIQNMRILTEQAALVDLNGELTSLLTVQSVYIEASASGIDKSADLATIKNQITAKRAEITQQEASIASAQAYKDTLTASLQAIVTACSISANFTGDNAVVFDRLIRDGSNEDSNFVIPTTAASGAVGETYRASSFVASISGCVSETFTAHAGQAVEKSVARFTGGNVTVSFTDKDGRAVVMAAPIISASAERLVSNGDTLFTAYVSAGTKTVTTNGTAVVTKFDGGCVSVMGVSAAADYAAMTDGTGSIALTAYTDATRPSLFFTVDTTEYQRCAVELELKKYGEQLLATLASPSYEFSVESSNFLALDDFIQFKLGLELGKRAYLRMNDGRVLTPIVIGVEISYDDISSMKISFGDKYTTFDSAFKMVDLLEQSVSMGRSVDYSKYTWNDYVSSGDKDQISSFMNGALDVARNTIVASGGQDVSWDAAGIHLRKANGQGGYEPEQIRIMNRMIAFTDDDWATVRLALGHYRDAASGIDSWGVIADNIVGKMLAGQKLTISALSADGTQTLFRVDSSGALLYNGKFDLASANGRISLAPGYGFAAGATGAFAYDANGKPTGIMTANGNAITSLSALASGDSPVAKLWLDMDGNAYFKGTVYADSGVFSGIVKASDFQTPSGTSMLVNGKWDSDYLDLGNIVLDGATGAVTIGPAGQQIVINSSGIQMNGTITWSASNSPVMALYRSSTANPPTQKINGVICDAAGTSVSGNWTTTPAKYACYSYDGGSTWTAPIQLQGTDGSDAYLPGYITATVIGQNEIAASTIRGNTVGIYANYDAAGSGGFYIYDTSIANQSQQVLSIRTMTIGNQSSITMDMGQFSGSLYSSAAIRALSLIIGDHAWDGTHPTTTSFRGDLDFSLATSITALTACFG